MARVKSGGGGSKFFVAIIAFILGFVFAIVAEVGVIVGAGAFVMNSSFDQIFKVINFNNEDAEGNQYINTDGDNGGATNIKQLVDKLTAMYNGIGAVTVSEVETLFPAMDGLTASVYSMLEPYIELDYEELESTKFMDLPQYLQDKIMEVRPAKVMIAAGMEDMFADDGNELVKALLMGVEAQCVYVNPLDKANSERYPVYFDVYAYAESLDKYFRTESVKDEAGTTHDNYPENLTPSEWLTETGTQDESGQALFRQYYFPMTVEGQTVYFATKADENGDFAFTALRGTEALYSKLYGDNYFSNTGNFYIDKDGNTVDIQPITVRSLTEDTFAPLYNFAVSDFLGGDELISEVFEGVTVGQLLDGKVDFQGVIGELTIPAVMDIDPESPIMTYIGYNLTEVTKVSEGVYTGYYNGADGKVAVNVSSENGVITSVTASADGREIAGVSVSEVPTVVDSAMDVLAVGDLMPIEVNNTVMAYLGYGISNVTASAGDGYTHTANYEKSDGSVVKCYINTTGAQGEITQVYYVDGSEKVTVPCCKISGISDAVENVKITALMSVKADDAIMAYLGYGITDLVKTGANTYTARYYPDTTDNYKVCAVDTGDDGVITSVRYTSESGEVYVSGTTVDGISDRVSTITKRLSLSAVMDVEPDSDIMAFIAFSVTDLQPVEGAEYAYTATYHEYIAGADGETHNAYPAYVYSDGTKITAVKYLPTLDGEPVDIGGGTKIDGVSAQVDRLTTSLKIKQIVNIDPTDRLMVKVGEYTVQNVSDAINDIELPDVMDVNAGNAILGYLGYNVCQMKAAEAGLAYQYTANYKNSDGTTSQAYITTDEAGIITGVYLNPDLTNPVAGTPVKDISSKVDSLTNDLTLCEVVPISDDDKILGFIKNSTIANIPTDISNLTVQQLFCDDIYGELDSVGDIITHAKLLEATADANPADGYITFNETYVYYEKDENDKLTLVHLTSEDTTKVMGKLTVAQFAEYSAAGKKFYTYGKAKGIWAMLLSKVEVIQRENPVTHVMEEVDVLGTDEGVYRLNDMNTLMFTAVTNMSVATLFQLADAGIIGEEALYYTNADGTINKDNPKTVYHVPVENGGVVIGNLILSEAFDYLTALPTR